MKNSRGSAELFQTSEQMTTLDGENANVKVYHTFYWWVALREVTKYTNSVAKLACDANHNQSSNSYGLRQLVLLFSPIFSDYTV